MGSAVDDGGGLSLRPRERRYVPIDNWAHTITNVRQKCRKSNDIYLYIFIYLCLKYTHTLCLCRECSHTEITHNMYVCVFSTLPHVCFPIGIWISCAHTVKNRVDNEDDDSDFEYATVRLECVAKTKTETETAHKQAHRSQAAVVVSVVVVGVVVDSNKKHGSVAATTATPHHDAAAQLMMLITSIDGDSSPCLVHYSTIFWTPVCS